MKPQYVITWLALFFLSTLAFAGETEGKKCCTHTIETIHTYETVYIEKYLGDDELRGMTASVAALASIDSGDVSGESIFMGFGIGIYKDVMAGAIGFEHHYEDVSFKLGISKAEKIDPVFGAGMTFKLK